MIEIKKFVTKPAVVEGFRYIRGVTTKAEVLAFCPSANIGTLNGNIEATDFSWFTIQTRDDGEVDVKPGDYITKDERGNYSAWPAPEFLLYFAEWASSGCVHDWARFDPSGIIRCTLCGRYG